MHRLISDTHRAVEKVLISLARQKSISEKLSQMQSLTSFVLHLSKRVISRANPGINKRELDLLFVEYNYGKDLSDKVRNYLKARS